MVVCQPGITDVAKSKDTIVCTESTSGVARPANTSDKDSSLCQCLVEPDQPKEAMPYKYLRNLVFARSRIVPKSGIKPEYQNKSDTVKYVEMANTSHISGEAKFGQSGPRVLG